MKASGKLSIALNPASYKQSRAIEWPEPDWPITITRRPVLLAPILLAPVLFARAGVSEFNAFSLLLSLIANRIATSWLIRQRKCKGEPMVILMTGVIF